MQLASINGVKVSSWDQMVGLISERPISMSFEQTHGPDGSPPPRLHEGSDGSPPSGQHQGMVRGFTQAPRSADSKPNPREDWEDFTIFNVGSFGDPSPTRSARLRK
eukprot:TRINITY_DN6755_c0_g1_i1.p1 TRINITY_DN6755_c0_g1~~TRINITY_DN6755_c0_g1_i1.p1  ORF type:complete len:106 (+),score=6.20 TRINITY_DN6755_c0_g1_i1:138-455(+)